MSRQVVGFCNDEEIGSRWKLLERRSRYTAVAGELTVQGNDEEQHSDSVGEPWETNGTLWRIILATVVLAFFSAGAATAWVGSHRALSAGRPQLSSHLSRGMAMKAQLHSSSDYPCGQPDEDTDYWTQRSLTTVESIPSAESCHSSCRLDPKCGAWTWGKARHIAGLSDVCFLKALEPGESPRKVRKDGVVSGLRMDTTCETSASETSKFVKAGEIKPVGEEGDANICLEALQGSHKGGNVRIRLCSGSKAGGQQWTYNEVTGQIRSNLGLCLTAQAPQRVGGRVQLGPCDEADSKQQWTYGDSAGRIKLRQGLCLDANMSPNSDGVVHVWTCDYGNVFQVWRIGKAPSLHDCNEDAWPDRDHNLVCGECKVLVDNFSVKYKTCEGYCLNIGHTCAGAWDDRWDSCKVKSTLTCNQTLDSSDAICECRPKGVGHWPRRSSLPNTLFCFTLMMPNSYEQQLLKMQHQRSVSIFACQDYAVYSNVDVEIAHGLHSRVVQSDLHCEKGGEFQTALNLGIFKAVWKRVLSDGQIWHHNYTVKVDADAVFFADRLLGALRSHPETPQGIYLNNCKFGMHGPLEVFSRNAVQAWAGGQERCTAHFNELCHGDCKWGEDMFIDQCLWKVLGVRRDNDWSILLEDHCDPPPGWDSCTDDSRIAFHPFKNVVDYERCLSSATS